MPSLNALSSHGRHQDLTHHHRLTLTVGRVRVGDGDGVADAEAEPVGRLRTERDLARTRRHAAAHDAERRRARSACIETPVMRSPPASTWPKWMIPMSSTPSTASSSLDVLLGRRPGARVQFQPLLRGSSTQRVEAGAEGHGRDDPATPNAAPTIADRTGTVVRPSPGSRAIATPSWLDGAKRPLASRDAAGRRARRRRSGQADPGGAPRAEGRARTEQEHEQQRADPEHEHVDVDPGVGLGLPRLADRHQRASPRSRARRPARRRPR